MPQQIGPVTLAQAASHLGPLPRDADLVVIGGGVAGVMTAWFAARGGARVVLCEKGRIAGEQSSRNWGWIRQQGRDADELPIVMESARIWAGLQAETEEDLGVRRSGTCHFFRSDAEREGRAGFLEHAQTHGLDTRIVDRKDLEAMFPSHAGGWQGALWTPSDLRAEPWVAVPALARAAARAGVTVREECAVRALDIEGGRIAGVVTEAGRVRAPRVVLCGGAWSSLLLRAHGVDLPQLSVRATVTATAPLPLVSEIQGSDGEMAFRRRADGGYSLAASGDHDVFVGPDSLRHARLFWPILKEDVLGTGLRPWAPRGYPDGWRTRRRWEADEPSPFEHVRVLNPPPNARHAAAAKARFEATFPSLGPVGVAQSWAGMIDTMPDAVPVLDEVAALPGLVVLTGLSGHGFGIGPGVGRVAADLALGRTAGHDLTRFRLGRFSDGSPIRPGPHL